MVVLAVGLNSLKSKVRPRRIPKRNQTLVGEKIDLVENKIEKVAIVLGYCILAAILTHKVVES